MDGSSGAELDSIFTVSPSTKTEQQQLNTKPVSAWDQTPSSHTELQALTDDCSRPSLITFHVFLFQLLEDNIISFVKAELKQMQKIVDGDDPESSESQMEGEEEEQRRSSREAFLKITLCFLKMMKQEELAQRLQNSKSM